MAKRDTDRGVPETLFRKEALESATSQFGTPIRSFGVTTWAITLFMALFFLTVIVFLFAAKYSRKEEISGVLEPSAGALRVVASKAGEIAAINVDEGQLVTAGASLFKIDLDSVSGSGATLGTLLDSAANKETGALSDERRADISETLEQTREIDAKIAGATKRLARDVVDITLENRRLDLQQESLDSLRDLNKTKIVSDLQYRDKQDGVIQIQQAISSIKKDWEDTSSSIDQMRAEKRRLRAELNNNEAKLRDSAAQLDEKRAANSVESEVELKAPVAGHVTAIQARVGSSVSPGTAVAIILPEGSNLEAELWAPSKAEGFVQIGDPVRIMFDAFPYQRFGVGHGHVTAIARAPTRPADLPVSIETKESLYRIDVQLDRQAVSGYGRGWPLIPGMRVTAALILEQRSFIQWLFDPVIAASKRD